MGYVLPSMVFLDLAVPLPSYISAEFQQAPMPICRSKSDFKSTNGSQANKGIMAINQENCDRVPDLPQIGNFAICNPLAL